MYKIIVNEAEHRVEVDFAGGFTPEDLQGFDNALRKSALQAKGGADHFDMLVDFLKASVMPQSISRDSEVRIAWCLENGLRKSANVVETALMKLQIQRVSSSDRFRYFSSRAEALAWLRDSQ